MRLSGHDSHTWMNHSAIVSVAAVCQGAWRPWFSTLLSCAGGQNGFETFLVFFVSAMTEPSLVLFLPVLFFVSDPLDLYIFLTWWGGTGRVCPLKRPGFSHQEKDCAWLACHGAVWSGSWMVSVGSFSGTLPASLDQLCSLQQETMRFACICGCSVAIGRLIASTRFGG